LFHISNFCLLIANLITHFINTNFIYLYDVKRQCRPILKTISMANLINLTVMGGAAAPYNASGPLGNPWSTSLGGVVNGISESVSVEVQNIIRVNSYVQPSGNPFPAVNSVVRYKAINPTSGKATVVKMYVFEAKSAIVTAANA
jgi:hypothetical protein